MAPLCFVDKYINNDQYQHMLHSFIFTITSLIPAKEEELSLSLSVWLAGCLSVYFLLHPFIPRWTDCPGPRPLVTFDLEVL